MFDISNARFAFLDIETTGLSPWFGDRICQIAVVITEGKRIKSTVDLLLNPERELSPSAAHVNGLDESKLSASPKFAEITDQLEALLKDAVIVCHNAKFDLQFLDNEYRKLDRTVEYPNLIDTLLLARDNFDLDSYSLQFLADAFHVSKSPQESHAMADALTAKNIFFAMMDALNPLVNRSTITSAFITRPPGPRKACTCRLNSAKPSTADEGCSSNIWIRTARSRNAGSPPSK